VQVVAVLYVGKIHVFMCAVKPTWQITLSLWMFIAHEQNQAMLSDQNLNWDFITCCSCEQKRSWLVEGEWFCSLIKAYHFMWFTVQIRDVNPLPLNWFPFLKSDTVLWLSQMFPKRAVYYYRHRHSHHLDITTIACLSNCSCPAVNSPFPSPPHGPMLVTLQQTEM